MTTHRPSSESGFTLLELMLVIGVTVLMFAGIARITQSWVDSESASGAGQHLARVSQITQRYIEARFDMLTPSDDVLTDAQTPGSVWEDLRTTLQQEGLLTGTLGELRSPFNVPMRISYLVDNSVAPPVYRASIFTTDNLPNKRVLQAARQAGNNGGTVTVMPGAPTTANTAIGAFGQWRIAVNLITPSGVFPCARTQTRGCLISVLSFNQDTLCGPYLYRNDVETTNLCANGNTMAARLNMGGNDIQGANTIDTRDLDVRQTASLGDTTVTGASTFNGPVTASNGVTVAGGMDVSGNANFSDTVNMAGGGNLNVTNLNASNIEAASIRANNVNATNLNATGDMTVDHDVTINGNVDLPGAGNAVYAATVNAGTVNTTGGAVTVGSMNVQNTMNVTGTVDLNNNTLNATRVTMDNNGCMNIAGTVYGNPGGGC